MIGPHHQSLLAGALADLLGPPTQGAVAFLRCLPSAQIEALMDSPGFDIPGWIVNAVVDRPGPRRITADQAVEQREDKEDSALFLIDPMRAGAGLDGIYNAAREIGEAELFKVAHDRARRPLRGRMPFLRAAIRRAERLGRRRRLTPWREFDFYIAVATEGEGKAIARLGLWPMMREGAPDDAELDVSAAMSDRLLFAQDARSVGERVQSLLLENAAETAPALESFLRRLSHRSPDDVAAAVANQSELWLGPLQPRFLADALLGLRLTSWRDTKGAVLKWSGLTTPEGDTITPRLILDRDAATKDRAKLTVRWTTEPEQLAAGSVDYRVTMLAGEEMLAEVTASHRDKPFQQAVFSVEDFDDLEGGEKFEAFVQITAVAAEGVAAVRSEEFVLEFGQAPGKATAGSGQVVRTLVEGAVALPSRGAFEEAVGGASVLRASEDRKGFIIWKGEGGGRAVRVLRPALIRQIEEDWRARGGAVGRWVQSVRADGSPVGGTQFVDIAQGGCNGAVWERVRDASRRLASDLGPLGLLARVQVGRWAAGDAYLTGWAAALESGDPELALHGTVEVQSQSGRTLGLLVTPLHPLRFAWHGLYDQVIANARYEQGLSAAALQKEVKSLDSAHFPFALPGIGVVPAFVFADVLGFHTVAMTVDGEPEPKGTVAVLSNCLGGGGRAVAPSIGVESAEVLAREVRHFLDCHKDAAGDRPDLLNIQAWRPGDGMTVARALGQVLSADIKADGEDDATSPLCFTLDIFHPAASSASGQFLVAVGRRRRSGGGMLDAADRWMAETSPRPGGMLLPRLRWAKRSEPEPADLASWADLRATHLGLIFDVFEARLETRPVSELGEARPLHVYGLTKSLERRIDLTEDPEWTVFAAPELTGETAPDSRTAGERLRRLDRAVSRVTARALGGDPDHWPVLVTRLPFAGRSRIERLHERSDWVVTIDRNAGLEYFDAPRDRSEVYERFVIDAVPDRADLGALQLVTSTTNLDAVRDMVDQALGDMGLSSSERNSRFLIEQLKGLSGRLAIRLANASSRTGELIALALLHANCVVNGVRDGKWLDITQGFFVPVDEIANFAPIIGTLGDEPDGGRRADFIHVSVPARGPLEFRFVEVKHRLHLRTARQPELLLLMLEQTGGLRRRWMSWFFDETLTPLERAVRRWQLALLLRFYAGRASRHRLTEKAHARLRVEIDLLVLKESYQPAFIERPDIGYVFCPEHRTGGVEPLYPAGGEQARFWLFGPALLPDERGLAMSSPGVPSSSTAVTSEPFEAEPMEETTILSEPSTAAATEEPVATRHQTEAAALPPHEPIDPIHVVLGTSSAGPLVEWIVSIRSNPHLMMVGLPGMGKTTALVNICHQLADAGVAPIIFSYHEDIDAKLIEALGPLNTADFDGLGFNPLRVDSHGATAHIDVAGTLRDIFGSIFPDLGEIQLEELRQAIKQSYDDLGWGMQRDRAPPPDIPKFRAFFDILKSKQKPNLNLLARLQELADYGFFEGAGDRAGLLSHNRATLVRIHSSTNSMLQNAFSSFVLYSIYKDMFRRGLQDKLTHAIIFDEAHRAAKLKLIPRFAKECRKFGLALALASQGAKDFDSTLYEAVGSYLILRVTEADARALARNTGSTADQQRSSDRLKSLEPYTAMFFTMTASRATSVRLRASPPDRAPPTK